MYLLDGLALLSLNRMLFILIAGFCLEVDFAWFNCYICFLLINFPLHLFSSFVSSCLSILMSLYPHVLDMLLISSMGLEFSRPI